MLFGAVRCCSVLTSIACLIDQSRGKLPPPPDDDGQKMAKSGMPDIGIDLDQQACVGVETAAVSASPAAAAAPGQFWRRATALLRSPRLGASANRASGDDTEQRGHICECPVSQAIELPHVVTEGAARLIGGGATSGSVAAGDLPRVLPSRERLGLVRRGAVGAGLLYRWRRRWLEWWRLRE